MYIHVEEGASLFYVISFYSSLYAAKLLVVCNLYGETYLDLSLSLNHIQNHGLSCGGSSG